MGLRERAKGEMARNTLLSLANEGFSVVSAILGVLLLIPNLGSTQYGAFASLFAMTGPFAAFAHSGVLLTILEHTVGEGEDIERVGRSCMSISFALSILFAPVCLLLGGAFVNSVGFDTVVLFVLSELIILAGIVMVISLLQAAGGYVYGIVLRVLLQLLRMSVLVALAVAGSLTLPNLILANTFAFVGFLIALVLVAKRLTVAPRIGWGRIERRHVKSTFLYSFGISAGIVQNDGDKFVLEASGHTGDTGVYAAGYRLLGLGMLPLAAFTGSTHWAVLNSFNEAADQWRKAVRFALVSAVYAVPAAIVLALCAPLAPKLLGDDFDGTASVIRWLAPVVVIRGLSVFPLNGLLALGANPLRTVILVANGLFSLVLYLVLVPPFSWQGAVTATLIGESTMFIAAWTALRHRQRQVHREEAELAAAGGGSPDAGASNGQTGDGRHVTADERVEWFDEAQEIEREHP